MVLFSETVLSKQCSVCFLYMLAIVSSLSPVFSFQVLFSLVFFLSFGAPSVRHFCKGIEESYLVSKWANSGTQEITVAPLQNEFVPNNF